MFALFGPRLPIDDEELEWQLATFKWLIAEFGGVGSKPLILPTPRWFPASEQTGSGRVQDLFDHVKRAARMEDWPCELEAGPGDRPVHAGNALLLRHEEAPPPCGTFRFKWTDGKPTAVITYNPGLAEDTVALVATFAHELAHYLLSCADSQAPGGSALNELHTDMAAVYLGFGIFLANSARSFGQYQSGGEMGWSSRTQGYLSEGALVTALAIFQRLAGRDPLHAEPYLKDYLGCTPGRLERLKAGYAAAGKKLDMGKVCLRFRKAEELAEDAIAEAIAAVPVETLIAEYEASRGL